MTPRRPAFTILELIAALALAAAMMVATVQVLALVASQNRGVEQRQRALAEVANVLEAISARPWADLTEDKLKAMQPSAEVAKYLRDAKLTISVAEDAGPPAVRRIAVSLAWRNGAGEMVSPVRLTAWRSPPREMPAGEGRP